MKFIIVHGTMGSPDGNWFPWLKRELEAMGHEVAAPSFPTPEGQNLSNWLSVLDGYSDWFGENLVLVGHSMGPGLILGKLEILDKPICAAFLVSGFTHNIPIEPFRTLNSSFVEKEFDWERIKKNCRDFFVYHGDDDPYVPLHMGQELAGNLGVECAVIHKGKHLNAENNYFKFPRLLRDIQSIL